MKILVTGGAGYIGSHTIVELMSAGMEPVIVDNFSNSSPEVIDRLFQITGRKIASYDVDVTDETALRQVFEATRPDGVIHFAGFKAVGESVSQPLDYYQNNLGSVITLARVMAEFGVKQLVFSSSATVYGDADHMPIAEDAPVTATNPYGWTKLMGEQILRDLAASDNTMQITLLRYFNPVGAHESGLIGEDPLGEPNNIMPLIAQVATGKRPKLSVFGADYDTLDGTGVRDYIHVVDLAQAHVSALQAQSMQSGIKTYNLGTGRGFSVLELVKTFEQASGCKIAYEVVGRRPGDVATCYADPSLAQQELGWKASKTLEQMCADVWRFVSKNPTGYTKGNVA
jgi:UDP-glucose 4-epimerase